MVSSERVQISSSKEDAFTVIELLVTVLIISILAAIAVPLSMAWYRASNDDIAHADAVSFSMRAGYDYQHEATLPEDGDVASRLKFDEDNRMALVTDGTTVCLLSYNTGGKEYTYENPFVVLNFEAVPPSSPPVSCPLDITAASWS